jgi:hypothetical protein
MGFVVDEVTLGQIVSDYLCFITLYCSILLLIACFHFVFALSHANLH